MPGASGILFGEVAFLIASDVIVEENKLPIEPAVPVEAGVASRCNALTLAPLMYLLRIRRLV